MDIDRRKVIGALGGPEAVEAMNSEARAEALEQFISQELDAAMAAKLGVPLLTPTVAELEEQIESRNFRKGVGSLFVVGASSPFGNRVAGEAEVVRRLPTMPERATLLDFYRLRFYPATHVLQSADKALTAGMPEEIVLACLLHDAAQSLMKADHGWWGAQLFEPYVSPKVAFAIRYHQALRFYPDAAAGYEYPTMYFKIFGKDYEPPPYIQVAYEYAKKHEWYMAARMVTVNDLYSFDPNHVVDVTKFTDIVGRHFKQPKEGLGFDNSPVAHMWRTMINPDAGL